MSPASPDSLRRQLAALPRPAWFLFLGTFLNKFGGFVLPFLTLYLTRTGHSLFEAGLAVTAYGAGNFSASLCGGYLADALGRRRTIVLSMFSGAAAMLLLSQARALPAILACAALAGLTGELYRPAASALLADLVPSGQRVTAYSTYRMALNAGWAFGPATAGFLAQHGFFWLFAGDAATSVLYGLVALVALPRDVGRRSSVGAGWGAAWPSLRRDRMLHQMLLASFLAGCVMFQISSTLPVAMTGLGFSAMTYGLLNSTNGALVVCFELPLTTLTRRWPARGPIAVGYLLLGGGASCFAFARTLPELIAAITVFTLGEMISMPVSSAFVADLAPADLRGRYMGSYGLTWTTAMILGPSVGLRLCALHPSAVWLGCGAAGLAASLIIRRPPSQPQLALVEP